MDERINILLEGHKNMLLSELKENLMCYVLVGSTVKDINMDEEKDIDILIIINDNYADEEKKDFVYSKIKEEIKNSLIVMKKSMEIKNEVDIQLLYLSDYLERVKESDPVILGFLRTGLIIYDKGIFNPIKKLLERGKLKPSIETVKRYVNTSYTILKNVDLKIKRIISEDIYFGVLMVTQALLMLKGIEPLLPKEIASKVKANLIEKEKILDEKDLKFLRKIIDFREKRNGNGNVEIRNIMNGAKRYIKKIDRSINKIIKVKNNI